MMNGKMLGNNIVYRILNVVVVFVINVLLSRLTGVAGYGLLSLMIANATIFNLVTGMGADAGITFNTAAGRMTAGKIFSFISIILLFQVVMMVLSETISWLATGQLFLFKTMNLQYAWIGPLYFLSISIVEKLSALLNGRKQFSTVNLVLLMSNLVMMIFFAIYYLMDQNTSIITYVSVFVLMNFLQAILLIIVSATSTIITIKLHVPGRSDASNFFSYSLFAFVINIVQFLAYRVDYWILDYYKGEEELGWYSLAVRLSQLFWVLPILFASIILPVVAGNQEEYEQSRMHALIRGMNIMNIMAGILIVILAPYLLPWLFGREYQNSVVLLQLLTPGVILFCVATVLAAWFAGRKMLKVNFGGSLLCLFVILVLDLLLIPRLGARGAAIASTAGYGITGLYFVIIYCSIHKVPVSKLFIPGRSDRHYINGILTTVFSKK
jgi:O-antigen/teichoic acid export membrane protein